MKWYAKGHYIKTCPKKGNSQGQVHTQVAEDTFEGEEESEGDEMGYIYHQNLPGLIWKTCLLIDSESSVNIFNNKDFLTRIYKAKKPLKLNCNGGCVNMIHKGCFGETEVW